MNKSLSRCLSSAKRRFLKIMQEKDKRVLGFFFFFSFQVCNPGKKGMKEDGRMLILKEPKNSCLLALEGLIDLF